jgi:hypothetical protein
MSIKISRAIKLIPNYLPSERDPHITALEQSGLADTLTAAQLAAVIRLMQQAYRNGKAQAGSEKLDNDAVWVERQADGNWQLTMPDKGVDKSSAAAGLTAKRRKHEQVTRNND